MKRILTALLFLFMAFASVLAQEQRDSLVRLISGGRARLVEDKSGKVFRMVEKSKDKDVVFFHNNTYLQCDTSKWDVDAGLIDAIGNIIITQGDTRLTGDKIHYISNKDLAEFRGSLVQLEDGENNILRTHFLDYNTRDSVALFYNGASMKDEDGNIIESQEGSYDSKTGMFHFKGNVEMYSDSLFFITDDLKYDSKTKIAYFHGNTKGWKDDNHMSSDNGWYNINREDMEFQGNVYALNLDYEGWAGRAYYDKINNNLNLFENIQLLDTANKVIMTGNELRYTNNPRRMELSREPVMIAYGLEAEYEKPDSAFISAERFIYDGIRKCDIDTAVVAFAEERLGLTLLDPIQDAKQKAWETKINNMKKADRPVVPKDTTAATAPADSLASEAPSSLEEPEPESVPENVPDKNIAQAQRDSIPAAQPDSSGISRPDFPGPQKDSLMADMTAVRDSLAAAVGISDSLAVDSLSAGVGLRDSLMADSLAVDSLIVERDTTMIDFLRALKDIKLYKRDIQIRCDSLEYTSLDSITRLYKNPIIWYDNKTQLTSDSVQFIVKDKALRKGYLLSNAFVVSETEDTAYFHQIKSPEMVGHFTEGVLTRMDALGGVSALFFFAEKDEISLANTRESRMMSANLLDGELQRIYNIEGVKSDALPVYDMTQDQIHLRGFSWQIDRKLNSRFDITDIKPRKSVRSSYIKRRIFPNFTYTERYFQEYLNDVILPVRKTQKIEWNLKIEQTNKF